MRFAVLGQLAVTDAGRSIALGGPKQRALLAVLLLHANEVVSRDRLTDAVWAHHPPPSAAESLDAYVYRLRKVLGHDRLLRNGHGYLLRVDAGECDVDRFHDLVARADQVALTDPADAVCLLTDALALWRGPAFAELEEPLAGAPALLEERRLSAVEARAEAQLRTGRGAELVPELEQLASDYPVRERLVAALMLALYRAGRQIEALAAYRAVRLRLREDLGLDPGPALRELEGRILRQDPDLLWAPGTPTPHRGRRRAGARNLRAAAAVTVAALVVAAFLIRTDTANRRPARGSGTGELLALNPASGAIARRTAVTEAPGALALGAGSLRVADPSAATILRIDPDSGVVVDRIPLGGEPGSIVYGGGSIWVASAVGATVRRVDPVTGRVTQTITLPGSNLIAVAFGLGQLWVADPVGRELFAVDLVTGTLSRTLDLQLELSAIAIVHTAIWVAGYDTATVEKIDPSSGATLARVPVGRGPSALAVEGETLWVANRPDGTVSAVDLATSRVKLTILVGPAPSALAAGPGSVWVGDRETHRVARIDTRTRRVTRISVDGPPTSLLAAAGKVWVGVAANGAAHRGGRVVILTTLRPASVDPALFEAAARPQFVGLAYDSLVTFAQSSGGEGLHLVADLAREIPVATDGGSTYTFELRRGIRYSDGRPLRAGDFRRGIERLFRLGSHGTGYVAGVVGAVRCARDRTRCDLSRGIVTDDAAGTVVFHLDAPDSAFLFKLTEQGYAAPIPPGTPDPRPGSLPPLGTGPYRIDRAGHDEVRFVRNAFFREWSHAAQPAGNPDAIIWRYVASARVGVAAVAAGRGDWLFGAIPAPALRRLRLQRPAQVHSTPMFTVDFVHLNTQVAPFDDVRVRRALNYAIDRKAIADLYGGSGFATPTCQPLAPGLPGYRRYCPYTRHPTRDGRWISPDLAKAIRLVDASGTRGERVDVWGARDDAFIPPGVPTYIGGVLRTLGYRVQVHLRPYASITDRERRRLQLSVLGDWLADYPEASSYLPQFFSCGGGNSNGYYCDPALDQTMRTASALEIEDPARSTRLWTSVDHRLTRDAGWVPTVNLRQLDYVSRRVHNYQASPLWGFLVDQSWVD